MRPVLLPAADPTPADAPAAAPRLRLDGEPAWVDAAGRAFALEPRDALLLAYLAIEGPQPRGALAARLWPQADGARAGANLRQRLFRLRSLAGVDLGQGGGMAAVPARLVFEVGGISGADRFAALTALVSLAADDGGVLAEWLEDRCRDSRAERAATLAADVLRLESEGDLAAALVAALERIGCEPASEHAHREAMRLHYLRGDRSAALLAFDRLARMLDDEVGARPSPATLDLLRTVKAADAGVATAGSAAPVVSAVPASVLRPPRLVGRTAELSAALSAWEAHRVICVEGEAGMGKTRLLDEIAARSGTAPLRVQARPGDHLSPYATLSRLLRAALSGREAVTNATSVTSMTALVPLLPELGLRAAPPPTRGLALGDAVIALFDGLRDAGLGTVIVDDLHFADEASLELLLRLSRAGGAGALRWGFARRPGEGAATLDELTEALLEEERFEPIVLAPLSVEQMAELLASLGVPDFDGAELAATLHRHSGGNPLFALETLRQAWADRSKLGGVALPRPVNVMRLIERRVMRLSPAAVKVARCAAVAGADFSLELASAVLALPVIDLADPWRELEQAQVFVGGGFAHDLFLDAVRGGLPQAIARHLHGEVARHLERHAGAPAGIAAHWLAAGDAGLALPFLHRAGQLASQQRRFAEAASAFEQEARLRLAAGDPRGAFAAAIAMRQAAFELDLASRTDAALALLDEAASGPRERAMAAAERAIVLVHRGEMPAAEAAITRGLAALDGPGAADDSSSDAHTAVGVVPPPAALRAQLLQDLAGVRIWQNRPAEAHELMRSIESEIEASPNALRRIEYAQAQAVVLEHLDRPVESLDWNRRAADAALAAAELPRAAQILLNLALGHRDCGQLAQALPVLAQAQTLLASLPEAAIPYSSLDTNHAIVLRDLGRYGEALDWFSRAIERGRQQPGWLPLWLAHRAQLWLALGQFARAQQDLDAGAKVDGAPPLARVRCEVVRGHLQGLLGQPAAPAYERAQQHLGANPRALSRARVALARCAVLEPADVLAVAGEVLDAATLAQRSGLAVAARARLATALVALGHRAEAVRHARLLAAFGEGEGCDDVYRGQVWLAAHHALAGAEPALDAALIERAANWVRETAARHVPEPFRDSFLHRNPINRELLAAASR